MFSVLLQTNTQNVISADLSTLPALFAGAFNMSFLEILQPKFVRAN